MSNKQSSLFSTKYLIWFGICFIGGLYIRHWANTGQGQFRRIGEIFNK